MLSGDKNTEFTFKYPKEDFVCYTDTPPPSPPFPTPVFPGEGVGKACLGINDDCGKDVKLCCGIAKNGLIIDKDG